MSTSPENVTSTDISESVFLKCCGFNWQLSHSHANNQPTEKLCPGRAIDCITGNVISVEKKITLQPVNKTPSVTSWSSAVPRRVEFELVF